MGARGPRANPWAWQLLKPEKASCNGVIEMMNDDVVGYKQVSYCNTRSPCLPVGYCCVGDVAVAVAVVAWL
jgi:hypothetical protein